MTEYKLVKDTLEIIQDLAEYTKLSLKDVQRLVLERMPYNYKQEFIDYIKMFQDEGTQSKSVQKVLINNIVQDFFYISSAYTLFGNAKHSTYIDDTSKLISRIEAQNEGHQREISFFEFGAGCGQMSLALKKAFPKVNVFFNEISAVQRNFFMYRCAKYNVNVYHIYTWDFNDRLPHFDIVTALDVFEHIKEYPKFINRICEAILPNGFLWEGSYFLENFAHDPTHCVEDKYNLHGIIKSNGFEKVSEPKMSEGNLWKKSV